MEKLGSLIGSITLSCMACSLLYVIIPKGSMEKTFKTVTAIFIIAVVASPLAAVANKSVKLDIPSISGNAQGEEYSALVNAQMLSAADAAARRAAVKIIPELETQAVSIKAHAEFDDDNYLHIISMTVVLRADSTESEFDVASRLESGIGIPVEVIINE